MVFRPAVPRMIKHIIMREKVDGRTCRKRALLARLGIQQCDSHFPALFAFIH